MPAGEAGAVMQTDYAGQTVGVVDPETCAIHEAQIFVAVLGASTYAFATASVTQRLPDSIAGQCEALSFFGGVPKSIVCDNLKAGVAKPLWFEPTLFERCHRCADGPVHPTGYLPLDAFRQRPGARRRGRAPMNRRDGHPHRLHRAGFALGERLYRELQRAACGCRAAPERRDLLHLKGRPGSH